VYHYAFIRRRLAEKVYLVKFAIQINAAPWSAGGGESAYRFVLAALDKGHEIVRVFFYGDGVYHALPWARPPQDEAQWTRRWSALAKARGVDLTLCISAAQRRGLARPAEGVALETLSEDLAEGFRVGGLGLWLEACLEADRFLSFG
jgi:tRNA 2-thiouridine synthesizing protein D